MKYRSVQWPQGFRGAGTMFAPANFQQNPRDYMTHANDNVIIIVQIETQKALENCKEIAKTDGIGKTPQIHASRHD